MAVWHNGSVLLLVLIDVVALHRMRLLFEIGDNLRVRVAFVLS